MKDNDEFTSVWRDYSRAFRPPDLLLGVRLTDEERKAAHERYLMRIVQSAANRHATQNSPAKPAPLGQSKSLGVSDG